MKKGAGKYDPTLTAAQERKWGEVFDTDVANALFAEESEKETVIKEARS